MNTKLIYFAIGCLFIYILIASFVSPSNPSISSKSTSITSQLPEGFVYLTDIDPTIKTSLRYAGHDNFVGRPVSGYIKPKIILTLPTAQQLKKVQDKLRQDGYFLVIYDAYRPQKASDDFIAWSQDPFDQKMKDWFYPRIDKSEVNELGYVAKKSGHSRGSTVDLTLIPLDQELHEVKPIPRKINDGDTLLFLDDGTLDMGSSWDLFDVVSHYESDLITPEQQERRKYLKETMEGLGFKNYAGEWWHYTLRDEPYPTTFFDFDVE